MKNQQFIKIFTVLILLKSWVLISQVKDIAKDTLQLNKTQKNSLALTHSIDIIEQQDLRHLSVLTYGRKTKYGSLLTSYYQANRFGMTDHMVDFEYYPVIKKGTYLFLGAGISFDQGLFPKHRFGLEVFQSFFKTYEGSIGLRQMTFTSKDLTILTASFGKYHKNYWFTGRIYYSNDDSGATSTFFLQTRRYFSDANHYLNLLAGYGKGISELGFDEYFSTKTIRFSASYQQKIFKDYFIFQQLDYRADERMHNSGIYQHTYIATLGLKYLF